MNKKYGVICEGLTKSFGKRKALDNLNLSIAEGELFALLGPNGAGKTTAVKILSGLLKPCSGNVIIQGLNMEENLRDIKGFSGISPQETAAAPRLTVQENLYLMGGLYNLDRKNTRDRAEELMEIFHLQDRRKEAVRKLSGGMQRKVSLAMAMVSDPKILYLDEPTLGLDPKSRQELWGKIKNLKRKKTIILTTHYLEEADALADRIGVIRQGRITGLGTPAELKEMVLKTQTMIIEPMENAQDLFEDIQKLFPDATMVKEGIAVTKDSAGFQDFSEWLKPFRSQIRGMYFKKPTLDDVFFYFSQEENHE